MKLNMKIIWTSTFNCVI